MAKRTHTYRLRGNKELYKKYENIGKTIRKKTDFLLKTLEKNGLKQAID